MMNFEYELYETSDGLYGQMDGNTEWNGMIRHKYFVNFNSYYEQWVLLTENFGSTYVLIK